MCYSEEVIKKLVVSNYRSLGESVEIPLGQLTALVGINAAGKSAILDVLRFVSECVRDGVAPALIKRNGLGAIRRRCETPNIPITIRTEMSFDTGEAVWEFSLKEDESGDYYVSHEKCTWEPNYEALRQITLEECRQRAKAPDGLDDPRLQTAISTLEAGELSALYKVYPHCEFDAANGEYTVDGTKQRERLDQTNLLLPDLRKSEFQRVVEVLGSIACYTVFPDQLRPPQKPDAVRRPMDEHGTNWASALRRLKKEGAGQELIAALGRIVGDITDYRVTPVGGYLVTEFRHGKQWLDASAESDGTLRIAGLLTALLQDPPLSVLGVEEPELTVHPGALPVLFDFLREASQRSQIVLSTHSPDLLDLLDIEQILVVSREETTFVAKVASEQRTAVRQHLLSTSDLLRAEGLRPESGERERG